MILINLSQAFWRTLHMSRWTYWQSVWISLSPSFCIFSTLASLIPLIASSSFLGAWANAVTVWIPPSCSFFKSAADMPNSYIVSRLGLAVSRTSNQHFSASWEWHWLHAKCISFKITQRTFLNWRKQWDERKAYWTTKNIGEHESPLPIFIIAWICQKKDNSTQLHISRIFVSKTQCCASDTARKQQTARYIALCVHSAFLPLVSPTE